MKVIQFTIPVSGYHTVIVQEDTMKNFYPHFHRHIESQITWIINGEGTLICGETMQNFKTNDLFIIGPNQPHVFKTDNKSIKGIPHKDFQSLTLFYNPTSLFGNVLELPEMNNIKKFVHKTNRGLKLPISHTDEIVSKMLKVKSLSESARLIAFIELLDYLSKLKRHISLDSSTTIQNISDTEGLKMNAIYQFILNNYTNHICLEEIAAVAFLSPQAFCRYFKKHTQKTFIHFINEIRIKEACKRLSSNQYEVISDIAYECGFSNAVTFNRVFKQIMACSPSNYKRSLK